MSRVLEVTHFVVGPDDEEKFLAKYPVAVEALRRREPSLLDARLARSKDGLWVVVTEWESEEEAIAAGVRAEELFEIEDWAEHISSFLSSERAALECSWERTAGEGPDKSRFDSD